MLNQSNRGELITRDMDQAARQVALSVCAGDVEEARYWAAEYAVHRDNAPAPAENTVILDGYRVRLGVV